MSKESQSGRAKRVFLDDNDISNSDVVKSSQLDRHHQTFNPSGNSQFGKGKILIVDDIVNNLRILSETLSLEGYEVRSAVSGRLALMGIEADPPELILLDIFMPNMDGFEVCRHIKANPLWEDIPIIFVSALGEVVNKLKAFKLGAVDFITKPYEIGEVLARVHHQLELRHYKEQLSIQNRKLLDALHKKEQAEAKILQLNRDLERRVLERTSALQTANLSLQQEMQQRQQAQAQMLRMAMYDSITGLANRTQLLKQLETLLHKQPSGTQTPIPLLLVDCDRLETIRNTLGHRQGDRLLKGISLRLQHITPPNSLVCRLEGDTFAILIAPTPADWSLNQSIAQLQHDLSSTPITCGNHDISIRASIGIVYVDARYRKAEYLLRDGNQAMEQAKHQPERWRKFEPEMHKQALQRLSLEDKLRQALKQDKLQVYFQPIVSLSANTHCIRGFEALIRWQPEHNKHWVSPEEFIPLAEETGLILPLGDWILATACRYLSQWNQLHCQENPLFLCVNFSIHQLQDDDIVQRVRHALSETQMQPEWLKIEVTETALMENSQSVLENLTKLRQIGVQVSIDDFGTGYSSLSYLKQLPVDSLKIDRSFVNSLEQHPDDLKIVTTILNLAKALDLTVVAEGIETQHQAQLLQECNCMLGQGYWFAKPLNVEQVNSYLANSPKP